MGLFKNLTTDEADILRYKLSSGAAAAAKGTGNYDVSHDLHDVTTDVDADRRERWNAENPKYAY
ncbi:MAG TPA: hypothetical protein VGG75_41115 [Trebonia sp.]|jgi:hypothetical protein